MRFLHLETGKLDIKAGILLRWGSGWIGYHYSSVHKRLCINLIPFVTFWLVGKGGDLP